ncbi:MAG: hypothetical protein K0S36_2012 [Nitrosospira multiformis]|jgi:hypothetical protein|nr:hypothetical protein [Nitrosospira multiformis]
MQINKLATAFVLLVASTVGYASTPAQNFDLNYSGNSAFHNDVIEVPFTIPVASSVQVWTDSGANFDPIVGIWNMSTGKLVAENDDNPTVAPGQTSSDSGLTFDSLGAGPYIMTITRFPNFASGDSLSAGFQFNHETPIPVNGGLVSSYFRFYSSRSRT